ncbi:MAG: metal-dependent hydrolase [Verrucomicrobia bacterium]|nr:metal-dependent hydrolase [Verrucomicrobiota bacterium]
MAAAALSSLRPKVQAAGSQPRPDSGLIDANVNLGQWPTRRLPGDEPNALMTKLRRHNVSQAWAGSFEGLLHKDIAAVNARLTRACRRHRRGVLVPFGSINPTLPDWEEELRRCAEDHGMPGIRLHPNYHGYRLDEPVFARLLEAATQRGLIVQLALVMEDERMMHPRLQVEPVDPAPLAQLVSQTSGLKLVLLNALRTVRGRALQALLAAGEVYVEIAMLEGVGGLENLLAQVPVSRVLFGSHAPLFYFESALLKLRESALDPAPAQALRRENARRLLESTQAGAATRAWR